MYDGFSTPGGLEIDLDPQYFHDQLMTTAKPGTIDKAYADKLMDNFANCIEALYGMPIAWVQIFSLTAVLFRLDLLIFSAAAAGLFTVGKIFTYIPIMEPLSLHYSKNRFMFCVLLLTTTLIMECEYLIPPYLILRMAISIISFIEDIIVRHHTVTRYSSEYSYGEMLSFRVFKRYIRKNDSLSNYVTEYTMKMRPADLLKNNK